MSEKKGYGYGGYSSDKDSSLFAAKEAYRTIRANLMFAIPHVGCKTLIFSSSVQGEGKTTTAVNVAFSLARGNKKVLLLDMDFRRPRVHRLMKLSVNPGLTNFLSGVNTLEDVLRPAVYPNLDLITAGTSSPNPAEMAASEGVEKLLQQMKEKYDFIIIDTPPLNVVSDALPLTKLSDGVVLVVRPKYTVRKDVQKSISQVEFIGGKVLGVVANGVALQKRGFGRYGYSNRKKYGYGYGYGYNAYTRERAESAPNASERKTK